MPKIVVAEAVLALALAFGAATNRATTAPAAPRSEVFRAAGDAGPAQKIRYACRCARQWPYRHYWRWDGRPVWDDPWRVLKPNLWGSPEPHLVPADSWARKWYLRRAYDRRWPHRQ